MKRVAVGALAVLLLAVACHNGKPQPAHLQVLFLAGEAASSLPETVSRNNLILVRIGTVSEALDQRVDVVADNEAPTPVITKRQGWRVAWLTHLDPGDPVAAAREAVAKLRGKADLIILISSLAPQSLAALTRAVPDIRLVVAPRPDGLTDTATTSMVGTPVVKIGYGEAATRLDLHLAAPGESLVNEAHVRALEGEIDKHADFVSHLDQQAGGAERVPDYLAARPGVLARYQRSAELAEEWREAIFRLRQSRNRFTYGFIPGSKDAAPPQ